MELVKADNFASRLEGLTNLPVVRQLGLMFGLAASVALGVAVVLWSQQPTYGVLFSGLTGTDAGAVMEQLQKQGITYKLDQVSGALMVPADKVHQARIQLADAGLPRSAGVGFELLDQKQEFGTSQFMETARYQRALEGELARSISAIGSVESARVHLALPKQSVFVRKREEPSASVLVNLYQGRVLEPEQISSVTHLVASSIPNLQPNRVTVVDQRGRLLTAKNKTTDGGLNQEQFEFSRRIEEDYVARIENILVPLVGLDKVRAQVSAELDFTVTERTEETYNPEQSALRSEQLFEQKTTEGASEGVPGALSNQPPGNATVPEVAVGEGAEAAPEPVRSVKRSTTNYELDRVISHSRLASGGVKRLSIAVVVDDRQVLNEEGLLVREPWPAEELDRLTGLVREAVGYTAERGDTVNVVNTSFVQPEAVAELAGGQFWKEAWFWSLGKQLLAYGLVLLLALGLLRMMRNIAKPASRADVGPDGLPALPPGSEVRDDTLSLSADSQYMSLPGPDQAYEDNLNQARQMAMQDPKRVAQVVRAWLNTESQEAN